MREQSQLEEPGGKPFAELVREAPKHQGGSVTLTGRVTQSEKEGHFVLDLGGGQSLELPVEVVRGYRVIEEGGRLVEVEVPYNRLGKDASFDTLLTVKEVSRDHFKDGYMDNPYTGIFDKPAHHDLISDPRGAVPFTLATGHHAPQEALGFQSLAAGQGHGVPAKWTSDPLTDKTSYMDSHTIHDLLVNVYGREVSRAAY